VDKRLTVGKYGRILWALSEFVYIYREVQDWTRTQREIQEKGNSANNRGHL
jgi:hypothetical protein